MTEESPVFRRNPMYLRSFVFLALLIFWLCPAMLPAQNPANSSEQVQVETSNDPKESPKPPEPSTQAQNSAYADHLFNRIPLGWDTSTILFIAGWILILPKEIAELLRYLAKNYFSQVTLGFAALAAGIAFLIYSISVRKKVLSRAREEIPPLLDRLPKSLRLVLMLLVSTVAASIIPLLLWGLAFLAGAFTGTHGPWFRLAGNLLGLWAIGSLAINLLRGVLAGDILPYYPIYGREIFRFLRPSIIYALSVIGLGQIAKAFEIRSDVLAFFQFAARFSIVAVFLLLFLKKASVLSLLPDLPYRSYRAFVRFLDRFYFHIIFLSAAVGVLMCLGYRNFAEAFFVKTWAVAIAYVGFTAIYHSAALGLKNLSEARPSDLAAQHFFRSARSALRYIVIVSGGLIILHLLGLLGPLQRIMSSPIFTVGETPISFWILARAVVILFTFVYASKLLQAYLDYKFYPSLGIETGLAYALNTLLKYFFFIVGLLIALRFVGLDLRVLMVLAGTAGIGIGFGLQSIVASMTSGIIIIFGRKMRKGDWVKVGDTIGIVSDIYLRATKVMTRDNIEYIIPNSEFITKQFVNYTLTSPFIRVHVPVGVSYSADPQKVAEILLSCAEKEPGVSRYEKPKVWLTEFGESSVNFQLLVWTDIRRFSRQEIQSRLNFRLFEALSEAGIEIPFPQRDIHVRSNPDMSGSL